MSQVQMSTAACAFDDGEHSRLEALDRYDILGSGREPAFDRIVRLIRNIFELPIGIVSVIDAHRQWYKAYDGLTNDEAAINQTFCRSALYNASGLFVENAVDDARFASNPFVTSAPFIRSYAGAPLRTPDGHSIGTICAIGTEPRPFTDRERQIMIDLAHLTMEEMDLRLQAMTDWLTATMTRRAFTEAARRLHTRSMRQGAPLAAMVFDIDHFKKVNDSHGHAAGDEVLKQVAQACRRSLRESDLFGRIGGEEFAILLPDTSADNAAQLADKLRQTIAGLAIQTASGEVSVTASFGVSELSLSSLELDTLIAQADTALYQAKAAGRNRVVPWNTTELGASDVRRRVLKAGRIVFKGGDFTADCTVRTLSNRSAGMDVIDTSGIPEIFRLVIPSDRIDRNCKVMARMPRHFEVAFI